MAGLPIVAICLLNQRLLDRSIFWHIAVSIYNFFIHPFPPKRFRLDLSDKLRL